MASIVNHPLKGKQAKRRVERDPHEACDGTEAKERSVTAQYPTAYRRKPRPSHSSQGGARPMGKGPAPAPAPKVPGYAPRPDPRRIPARPGRKGASRPPQVPPRKPRMPRRFAPGGGGGNLGGLIAAAGFVLWDQWEQAQSNAAIQSGGYFHAPPGWTLVNSCSPSQLTYNAQIWCVSLRPVPDIYATACLPLQAVPHFGVRTNPPPGVTDRRELVTFDRWRNPIERWANRFTWTRPAGPDIEPPLFRFPQLVANRYWREIRYYPDATQQHPFDPYSPPLRPEWVAPKPFNVSWEKLAKVFGTPKDGPEDRVDWYGPPKDKPKPVTRPTVRLVPRPGRQPKPTPQPAPQPSNPTRPPSFTTVFNPWKDKVKPRSFHATHARRPPRRNEKEKKLKGKYARAIAIGFGLFGQFTEILDFVEVVYRSLPKHRQEFGNVKVEKKLRAIYAHMGEIELETLARNWLKNQIEDYLYALRGKADAYR